MPNLSVRPIQEADIAPLADYWFHASPEFLIGMGVDLSKMPERVQWEQMLLTQIGQPFPEKQSYCIIWEIDGQASGHCNINKITFGKEASMHLHMWQSPSRQKGLGAQLVQMSLPFFFENYGLEVLNCEPYALNPAPNKTLEKVGFQWIKEYITTPGWINFEQPVNLWQLTREQFLQLP